MKIQLVPSKYKYVSNRQRCTGRAVNTHLYHIPSSNEPDWIIRVTESRGTSYDVGSGIFTSKHYQRPSLSNIRHKEDNRLRAQRRYRAQMARYYRERTPPEMIHVQVDIKRQHSPSPDANNNRAAKSRKVSRNTIPNR